MNPSTEVSPQPRHNANNEDGPELKLVYRTLRLISDWALSGFFSEVYVEGAENIQKEGPLILTPCHHNEIIDIATLSATIPHRRIISYWTKASLFKHTVSRRILTSAGALPVARNPRPQESRDVGSDVEPDANRSAPGSSLNGRRINGGHQELFDATYRELAKRKGAVLGVFPEGTSYTLPRIVQVKEGAARAALGFIRWRMGDTPNDLQILSQLIRIVPVGIVYTDKSRYQSRLSVRYGTPIDLEPFVTRYFSCDLHSNECYDNAIQESVRFLTEEIERRMLELTINAPNWTTLYAARTARALLWPDERSLPLKDFVKVSRSLVAVFGHSEREIVELKDFLSRYHALLFHAGLTNASLVHVPLPPSYHQEPPHIEADVPNRIVFSKRSIVKLASGLPLLVVPPLLSFPTHIAHVPAYVLGALASRAFAGEEEEGRAQYKVIFGGLGRALGTFASAFALLRSATSRSLLRTSADTSLAALKSCYGVLARALSRTLPLYDSESLEAVGEKCIEFSEFIVNFVRLGWIRLGRLGDWLSVLGIAWLLIVWHARVIDSNYIRYRKACATLTVLRSVFFSRRVGEVKKDELKPYLSTPSPPVNPFIAKSLQVFPADTETAADAAESEHEMRPDEQTDVKLSKSTIVKHLLLARADAAKGLQRILRKFEKGDSADASHEHDLMRDIALLRERGATF